MKFFVRAIVTGFGLSVGAALFKKVAHKLGLEDNTKKDESDQLNARDGATDPHLKHRFS